LEKSPVFPGKTGGGGRIRTGRITKKLPGFMISKRLIKVLRVSGHNPIWGGFYEKKPE
jgi:hypothetical protein